MPLSIETDEPKQYQKSFLTQYREKTLIVKVEDVALFMVQNETVYLFTFDGKKYHLFKKLDYVASVCNPKQFFRINRQMLVNRKAVVSFEPYFNRKIVLELEVKLSDRAVVSRLKVSAFKEWLQR